MCNDHPDMSGLPCKLASIKATTDRSRSVPNADGSSVVKGVYAGDLRSPIKISNEYSRTGTFVELIHNE